MLPHLRGWLDQHIDQRKQHMPKSNNRRKKPSQERHKKTTKNTENSQPGYQGINEYREISNMQKQPYPTQSENECRFPELFSTVGCCICGHEDAQECPCGPMETLVHLERGHPTQDSKIMRETLGCPINGSELAPRAAGTINTSIFQAPCGDMIQYMTTANFYTMAHYR